MLIEPTWRSTIILNQSATPLRRVLTSFQRYTQCASSTHPAGLLTLKKVSPSDMRSRRLNCSSEPTRKTHFPNECQALASRFGLESKTPSQSKRPGRLRRTCR